jgi:Uri superfamily endonuclease
MRSEHGTYALLLQSDCEAEVRVGRRSSLRVQPGYYVYVGSAFGPGGVKARVLRHCRESSTRHWHIDYLRGVTAPLGAWCGYQTRELEHRWAQSLAKLPDVSAVNGFGCSDCMCESHLFRSRTKSDFTRFFQAHDARAERWQFQAEGE